MTSRNQFELLRERRFAPFFWTQFMGAANDNLYKNALVLFIAFQAAAVAARDADALVNLAGAVFIAPFVLFSATAGQLADKLEKSRLIRFVKLLEIGIMVIGAIGFARRDVVVLFVALFLMGVHSTLFGPVKYAILPQHLAPEELIGGNGLVEMGTFVAILLGTMAGGLLVAAGGYGPVLAGASAIVLAVSGYAVSRGIPITPAVDPHLHINWNPVGETVRNMRFARSEPLVWRSMLAISWFWFYGATFLAQFAGYSRDYLGGGEHVVTFLLAVFSIGIGIGSLSCERLSARRVEPGLVPFGALGLTVFAIDLWAASRGLAAGATTGLAEFLAQPVHLRVTVDLLLIGVFGGFYVVPLYALIQARSDPAHRSRIIAANNILNALFMVVAALVATGLLRVGLVVPDLFLVTGIANAVVCLAVFIAAPEFLARFPDWLRALRRAPRDGATTSVPRSRWPR